MTVKNTKKNNSNTDSNANSDTKSEVNDKKNTVKCNFCGSTIDETDILIEGSDAHICGNCVKICMDNITNTSSPKDDQKDEQENTKELSTYLSPEEINNHLNQYVVGQTYAKMVMSVIVHNHYKRIFSQNINDDDDDGVEIEKSNCILIGPPASGKTHIAQTIARILNVPFVIADATNFTENGYIGEDVDNIIARLLQVANYDVEKAQHGIVFIDEIDKKAKKEGGHARDVTGEGVQQSMLKLLEGKVVNISKRQAKSFKEDVYSIDTKNILFIFGGAFNDLDKIINQRLHKSATIGFGSKPTKITDDDKNRLFENIEGEDLIKFGLIPELVGRIPIIVPLHELTEEQLVEVLSAPKNAITKQYSKLFKMDNIDLIFTDEALVEIARMAKKRKLGARGLRSVIEQKLIHTQFTLSKLYKDGVRKIKITKDFISNASLPEYVYKRKQTKRTTPKQTTKEN